MGLAGSASADLPPGWYETTIGTSGPTGSISLNDSDDTWTVTGYGDGTLHTANGAHYVYMRLDGDGQITARIASVTCSAFPLFVGVMIRDTLTPDHPNFAWTLVSHWSANGIWQPDFYSSVGGISNVMNIWGPPFWVRLVRTRNVFESYHSLDGVSWHLSKPGCEIPMGGEVYIGLAVQSGSLTSACVAKFDHVTVIGGTEPPEPIDGFTLPYRGSISTSGNAFSITNTGSGNGIYAKGGSNGYAGDFQGKVRIKAWSGGATVMELGEGLDYAEGFDVSVEKKIEPGTVLIIDPANPGKLAISNKAYDKKVAGIVAGGKGLGSGVRLGAGQFDYPVALAGRVYCNVDATKVAVEPGDLLTTSAMPGYAAKVVDYTRAQGAILGKAMEKLEKGKKGQMLVLVTLQ